MQTIKFNPDEFQDNKTKIIQFGFFKRRTLAVHYENGTFIFKELKPREERLKELKKYLDGGIITQQVYSEKVSKIMEEF